MREYIQNITLHPLKHFSNEHVCADILRLDLLHPVVSGNKWFKLQYYLQDALTTEKTTIATFGGAYSNHIVATAFAAKEAGLKSIGFIRGEMVAKLTLTLLQAKDYGMELRFVDRGRYRNKEQIMQECDQPGLHWIMEGGYGKQGAKGAADILTIMDTSVYTHILCAAGTGTLMAGLIKSVKNNQVVIGISVLKSHYGLEKEVRSLLSSAENLHPFSLLHGYHFGGYAKHPEELIAFMKDAWLSEQVPTDIVYTSKLLFAARDLIQNNYFPPGSKLLLIHSGGLQGNNSLQTGRLPFY